MFKKFLMVLMCIVLIAVGSTYLMRYLLMNSVENHLIDEGFKKDDFTMQYARDLSVDGPESKQVKVIFDSKLDYQFFLYKNSESKIELIELYDASTGSTIYDEHEKKQYLKEVKK